MLVNELKKKYVYEQVEIHCKDKFKHIVNRLSRYLGNKAAAEDILQTAYLNVLIYWNTYDEKQPFEKWFKGIVNNAIRLHFKNEIMHGMVCDSFSIQEDMEEKVIKPFFQRIELQHLMKHIEDQPDNIRNILILSLIEGYNSKELEKILPESASNIRKIIQRFRDDIREVK